MINMFIFGKRKVDVGEGLEIGLNKGLVLRLSKSIVDIIDDYKEEIIKVRRESYEIRDRRDRMMVKSEESKGHRDVYISIDYNNRYRELDMMYLEKHQEYDHLLDDYFKYIHEIRKLTNQ